MKLISLTCDKCNATLQVNPELKRCICQYCGNEMLIDDESIQVHHQMDNAYQTGYQMEMGRQQAYVDIQNRAIFQQQQQQAAFNKVQTQKKKRRIILGIIGVCAIGVLFLYKPVVAVGIAIVVGVVISNLLKRQ